MKLSAKSKTKSAGIMVGTIALVGLFMSQAFISQGGAAQNDTDPNKLPGIKRDRRPG